MTLNKHTTLNDLSRKTHSEQRHREMSAHSKVHKGVGADERRTPQDRKKKKKTRQSQRRTREGMWRRNREGGGGWWERKLIPHTCKKTNESDFQF